MEEQKKASGETKAVEPYLLSGILYCGECGSAMVGNRKTVKGNVYSAYYCGRKKRSFDCKAKSIVKEKIEGMVIEDFHKYVISELGSSELAEKIFKHTQEQNQDIINEVTKLNNDLKNVQMQIDNIVNVIANGIFNTSLKEKLDSLEAQKSEIQAWIFEAERQHEKYGYSMEQIKAFLAHDRDFDNNNNRQDLDSVHNKKPLLFTK
ncbi:MAG TPA: recombinase zinc beta ribbon domain-containing protein [Clostridia bacterium]